MNTAPKKKKKNNQLRVFTYLIENEESSYTDIKKALHFNDKTLSYILRNLVEKEIIVRTDDGYHLNSIYSPEMQKKITGLLTDIIITIEPYITTKNIGNNIKMILDYILQ